MNVRTDEGIDRRATGGDELTRSGPETAREFGITNMPAVENGEFSPTRAPVSASWSTLISPIALRN